MSATEENTASGRIDLRNERTLKRVFDQYFPRVREFAACFLGDGMLAADMAQEAFLYVWQKQPVLAGDEALKSYLYHCVKNKCLNYLRRVNCEKIIHRNLKIRAIDAYNMSLLESDSRDSGMFAPFRHVRDFQDSRCPERIAERLSPSRALSPDAEKRLNILDVFFAGLSGFYSIMIPYCIK